MNELHLFAGAGGGILGGMLLGHTCVCAVEIDSFCQKVLLQRQRDGILPKFPIWDDVRTFDGKPWRGKVDIICGGFPCQDISCAGKGAGIEGERSGLWSEFARIISEVRPRYTFVENSPMLALRGLGRVLGDLSEMGYDARWCVMGADDVGAPHIRKRMWILAYPRYGCGRGDFGRESRRLRRGQAEEVGERDTNKAVRPSAASETLANAEMSRQPRGLNRQAQVQFGRSCTWWDRDPADQDGAFESQLGRVADGVANKFHKSKPTKKQKNQILEEKLHSVFTRGKNGRLGKGEGQDCDMQNLRKGNTQKCNMQQGMPEREWQEERAKAMGFIPRISVGVQKRVDRLKAIGNGQVPLVAATAFRILSEGD